MQTMEAKLAAMEVKQSATDQALKLATEQRIAAEATAELAKKRSSMGASIGFDFNADPTSITLLPGSTRIGSGGNANVYKGTWAARKHGEPVSVAIKVIQGIDVSKLEPADWAPFEAEIKLGCSVKSDFLVQTFGFISELPGFGFSIVLELMDGGTLQDGLLAEPKPTTVVRIGWLIDTAAGMKCLYVCIAICFSLLFILVGFGLSCADMHESRYNSTTFHDYFSISGRFLVEF
jgi:hypothetical protein